MIAIAALPLGGGTSVAVVGAPVGGLANAQPVAPNAPTPAAMLPQAGAASYGIGPLEVTRRPNSTVSQYQLKFSSLPGEPRPAWTLDAPCGELAAAGFIAGIGWSFDQNRRTCPPGPQGPFPGTVKVTYTHTDGKQYTWTAGSEAGTFGETYALR